MNVASRIRLGETVSFSSIFLYGILPHLDCTFLQFIAQFCDLVFSSAFSDMFFFLQPVFKCFIYFYHIFDIWIFQNRIMYIDFMFLKVSVYLSQQFHAFLPVSWKITLAPASPAESHLIGIGLKFRPVNIKNLFFQCLFILYIQIDFFRNGFYRFFQCVIDEAFKALVAGNEAVCDTAITDIIAAKFFQLA